MDGGIHNNVRRRDSPVHPPRKCALRGIEKRGLPIRFMQLRPSKTAEHRRAPCKTEDYSTVFLRAVTILIKREETPPVYPGAFDRTPVRVI